MRLEHITDVRCTRRVGIHHVLERTRRQLLTDGKREEVDDFFRVGTQQVCAQQPPHSLFDQRLESGVRQRDPSRGVPA